MTAEASRKLSYAEDIRLHYNPERSALRFGKVSLDALTAGASSSRLPHPIPWPEGAAPTPRPLNPAPNETNSLQRFAGYDAIVITYTSAEAAALAALFTPGCPVSSWYEYRHNIAAYLPLVTGKKAPFNSTDAEDQRYYHSLCLYFPLTIGNAKVLAVKSGLHMDYDGIGPDGTIAFFKFITELVTAVQPKILITTGTGGGIGADVALGDVIVAQNVRFDCQQQFKSQPWANSVFNTSPLPASALQRITAALTSPNAAVVAAAKPIPGRSQPKFWTASSAIVTTDFFAFDTSNDYDHLQGLGQACDMGDAMVGRAMGLLSGTQWFAIRNASDPQVPMSGSTEADYKTADKLAGNIYLDYGVYTTAASVLAAWAIIASSAEAGL